MNRTDPIHAAQDWRAELERPGTVARTVVNRPRPPAAPGQHPWALTGGPSHLAEAHDILAVLERTDTGTGALAHARHGVPAVTDAPVPGSVLAYDPATGRPMYVHLAQPEQHAPVPIQYRERVFSRKATDFALVSLAASGASWMLMLAAHEGALAAAAWTVALEKLFAAFGVFLFFAAVIFGVIAVAKKHAGAVRQTFHQEIHQEIHTRGVFTTARIARTEAPFNVSGGHRR